MVFGLVIFILSMVWFIYVWIIYPLICFLFLKLIHKKTHKNSKQDYKSTVSVIIAAYNEEKNIENRISNILQVSKGLKLEIIVASDGSKDRTNDIVTAISSDNSKVRLIDIDPQAGRANAHNISAEKAIGDILVFTDADTEFAPDFLHKLLNHFQQEDIGFASGQLVFRNIASGQITESAGLYWRFEMFLRSMESQIGWLAFGTGACCAVRKVLYRDISATGDVDFITPLDVILQGYKCAHVNDAIAYDFFPSTSEREMKARIRMTSKNFHGTISHWSVVNVIKRPLFSWVIFSHKIGRWMTPFILILILVSSIFLAFMNSFFLSVLIVQILVYLAALVGMAWPSLPVFGQIYAFCLANVAFAIGIINAISGKVPSIYKPVGQEE